MGATKRLQGAPTHNGLSEGAGVTGRHLVEKSM
jgi:hypothetical protein